MILTPELEQQIIDAITADPAEPLTLPDWAYGKDGRVVVLVDGIPIDLHRHLFNRLIRPLEHHETLWHTPNGDRRNVNPWIMQVSVGRKSPRTHCGKGHAYEGNEAPPNSRGYRCLTCLRDSRRKEGATANGAKAHCPHDHEYTPENTRIGKDGRRRCITCIRDRNRAYMARRRKPKGTS